MIIDLCEKNLIAVPEEVWEQTYCEELYLFDNQIVEIPDKLNQLKNLRVLDLADNLDLQKMPNSLQSLEKLEYLNLGQTGFKEYPRGIFTLPNLKILRFLGNQLPHLPTEIENLKHLEELLLTDVQLQTIPKEISRLNRLKKLDLSYNSALTENFDWLEFIAPLKQLEFLYLLTLYIPEPEWTNLKKSLPNTQIYASAINYFNDKDQID